jgi:hypothetical protein
MACFPIAFGLIVSEMEVHFLRSRNGSVWTRQRVILICVVKRQIRPRFEPPCLQFTGFTEITVWIRNTRRMRNRQSMLPTPGGSAKRLSIFKKCVKTAAIIFDILLIQKFYGTVISS